MFTYIRFLYMYVDIHTYARSLANLQAAHLDIHGLGRSLPNAPAKPGLLGEPPKTPFFVMIFRKPCLISMCA